ncbi:nucleoside recognition domain-containing protein [Oscillospiraceae bacterium PP1C4]
MMTVSTLMVPLVIVLIVGFGLVRGVKVFDVFLEGAKEGIQVAVHILPALVALITAVGMFKASGGLDLLSFALGPFGKMIGLPREVMPLALLRPISGSGAMVLFTDILENYGPDSLIGRIASVIEGSSETTFYTIALYYGAAGIHDTRHSVPAALSADIAGFVMSALTVRLLFY